MKAVFTIFSLISLMINSIFIPQQQEKELYANISITDTNNTVKNVEIPLAVTSSTISDDGSVRTDESCYYVKLTDDEALVLTENEYRNELLKEKELGSSGVIGSKSTITDSSDTTGTYWKATVSITYQYDSTYCTVISIGASWSQQHGASTLSNRNVYWGGTLGINSNSGTYYPSSNSATYTIGWGPYKYGRGSIIGCNSSANYTTSGGATFTISASVSHTF